jgi:hypothetical protein
LFIIAAFIGGFWNPEFFLLYGAGILIKSLIDLPIMWGVTGFNDERKMMTWYLPFQVVYPFYVVVAGIWSLFERQEW